MVLRCARFAQGWNSSSFSASFSSSGIPASKYASSCFYVRKTEIMFYKALTPGKTNFKYKTWTAKRGNFTNFGTHVCVHARSVRHFGLHQLRRTIPTAGHLSTDSIMSEERVLYAPYGKLICDQSSCGGWVIRLMIGSLWRQLHVIDVKGRKNISEQCTRDLKETLRWC